MTGFGAQSTTDEVLDGVDLSGKRVLVTGVSAGLGVETARAIVARGGHVTGAARDLEKARSACAGIVSLHGRLELVELDLGSLTSVRACADRLLERGEPFDVVIANAGIMVPPFDRTEDGFELQFGTNHIGHFVLVNRIAPLLGPGARVIVLSSRGHHFSDVDFDDPGFERTPYDPVIAYGRAKTANALFALGFDVRHRSRGIRAAAVHPGNIRTELPRHMTAEVMQKMQSMAPPGNRSPDALRPSLKTVPQGAATSVWAAFVAPAEEVGGRYCEDCGVAPMRDAPADRGVAPYAADPDRAVALWARTEDLVGEHFR